jgi:selenocysteine-specific elongation factor
VRRLQSLQHDCDGVDAQARVAVNLRGVAREDVARGMALVTPGAWTMTDAVDVACAHDELPAEVVVHIGAAAVPARLRRLGPGAARLNLAATLPLHVGDRVLLRDPASRRVAGGDVAEVAPRPLVRRGDAARLASGLRSAVDAAGYVGRRGVCAVSVVQAAGFDIPSRGVHRIGSWLVSVDRWQLIREHVQRRLSAPPVATAGVPVAALAGELDLPSPDIVVAVAAEIPGVVCDDGRLRRPVDAEPDAPGLRALLTRLHDDPLDAPDAVELAALDVGRVDLGIAVRRGRLLRLSDGIYVGAAAPQRAAELLADLPEPFTVADARQRLRSSRRVVVPLLEHLDATRATRRLADGRRVLVRARA